MSDDTLTALLPALDLAAFERREDGSFKSIAPRPAWFGRLVSDPTFPFLGHILEEAHQFWATGDVGKLEWGPVAEVDESGQEFHYKVAAVATPGAQFLVFQLDQGSDQMRGVLQKVRTDLLAAEQRAGADAAMRTAHLNELRRAAGEFGSALRGLKKAASSDTDLAPLSATGDELLQAVDAIVQATRPSRH
ncbi:MAG: hypothetical protein ACRD2N_01810 [Vicinamibacterales bacterium]